MSFLSMEVALVAFFLFWGGVVGGYVSWWYSGGKGMHWAVSGKSWGCS